MLLNRFVISLNLCLTALLLFMGIGANLHAQEPKKIVGYYAGWSIYRNPVFKPSNIDASLVTHINYAFIKVDTQGNIILFDPWSDIDYRSDWNLTKPFWGNFEQLVQLKKKHPHLKTLFSVGGWTLSDTFSEMAANPTSRQNFVKQAIEFAERYQFDGIDLDWEYPGFPEHNGRPEDKQNFTKLLSELYTAAKAHSPQLLVTIAAPAGPHHMQNMELNQIHRYVDWVNLMTYDFHGAWGSDPVTNHNAPLAAPEQGDERFTCNAAVAGYLSQGFPKEKIVLGLPFYGRSFSGVTGTKDGLFGSYREAGLGTTQEKGMRFFYDIKRNLLPTYTRYWDMQAQVPYLYNPHLGEFVSYDDEESIGIKADFIKQHDLGGAMIWELGLDTWPDWDLLKVVNSTLKR